MNFAKLVTIKNDKILQTDKDNQKAQPHQELSAEAELRYVDLRIILYYHNPSLLYPNISTSL